MDDANFKSQFRACLKALPDDATACDAVADWDVSRVTDFSKLFWEPIENSSDWNLLPGAATFNVDLNRWHVTSKATSMRSMFHSARSFNQPLSPSLWDTSSVRDFARAFESASMFDQDISYWDTSSATDMSSMFRFAERFNSGNNPIFFWDVQQVKHFEFMFHAAFSFRSDISGWNVGGATDFAENQETELKDAKAFGHMFEGASVFNADLSQWELSSQVRSLRYMFHGATSFNVDLSQWNVQRIHDFTGLFQKAISMNQTLCWDVSITDEGDNNKIGSSGDLINNTIVQTRDMLKGTSTIFVETDIAPCLERKHSSRLHHHHMPVDIPFPSPPTSNWGKILYIFMVLVCALALIATSYRIVKRRNRRRRIIFRSGRTGKEEEFVFSHKDDNLGGGNVFEDAENYVDRAGVDVDDDEEGEISFSEETYPKQWQPAESLFELSKRETTRPHESGRFDQLQQRQIDDDWGIMT